MLSAEPEYHGSQDDAWVYKTELDRIFDTVSSIIFYRTRSEEYPGVSMVIGIDVIELSEGERKTILTVLVVSNQDPRENKIYVRLDRNPAHSYKVYDAGQSLIFENPRLFLENLLASGAKDVLRIRIDPLRSGEDLQFPLENLIPKLKNALREGKENRIRPGY